LIVIEQLITPATALLHFKGLRMTFAWFKIGEEYVATGWAPLSGQLIAQLPNVMSRAESSV
jgi:hypothetical protein